MNADPVSFDAPPRRRSRLPLLALLVLVAFAAGVALTFGFIAPAWERWQGRTEAPAAVAAPQPLAPAVPPGTDLPSLYAREIALAARIDGLEARLSNIDTDSRVASTFATRAEGLLVAFAARRALDRGLPLGYVESQLRERFGGVQPRAVAAVVQAAREPVTVEDLRAALDTLAPTLQSGADTLGWGEALRREIAGLVRLREEGTPSAHPAERLTRARRLLDAGQVEAALGEIARMPGADSAASWSEAARRYINARRALNIIEAAAIEGVGPPPAPPVLIAPPAAAPPVLPGNAAAPAGR
ncbi:YbbN family protein [Sphingomonas baiyangensis]|uniref:Inner membrane protein n=1 Tax=Sphingomonas baiyangensis TaxID=2572576 RepID=A0A4U1L6C0_9SPHN|nr:hypothetical protein [Sphingomonas baiyangensis]TKD51805.1 hypothetical protein FBR43_14370 [Sphingomonas baiyangensis]